MFSKLQVLQPNTKSRFWFEEKFHIILEETWDLDQIEGAEFKFLGPEMRFRRNSNQEFLEFDFDFRRNSNFDFRTKFRNFGRALFCNLTPILSRNRPKMDHIPWFLLASRGSPENFLLPSVAKIFLQLWFFCLPSPVDSAQALWTLHPDY